MTARIEIDLSARELRFFTARQALLKTPVAVGSPATPTPIGRFYVNQRILTTNPSGPYGPAALGVSAFSNVLTGWAQGGPIGIHGTNAALVDRPCGLERLHPRPERDAQAPVRRDARRRRRS